MQRLTVRTLLLAVCLFVVAVGATGTVEVASSVESESGNTKLRGSHSDSPIRVRYLKKDKNGKRFLNASLNIDSSKLPIEHH